MLRPVHSIDRMCEKLVYHSAKYGHPTSERIVIQLVQETLASVQRRYIAWCVRKRVLRVSGRALGGERRGRQVGQGHLLRSEDSLLVGQVALHQAGQLGLLLGAPPPLVLLLPLRRPAPPRQHTPSARRAPPGAPTATRSQGGRQK